MELSITNETRHRVSLSAVRSLASRAARLLHLPPRSHVQLVLVTDVRMRRLNRQARGVNRSTDVLAFPLYPEQGRPTRRLSRGVHAWPRDPDGTIRFGDVAIAVETARRQARERGATLADEVGTLFAHGLLHLLGYDHDTAERERRMARLQRILRT